MLVEQGWDLHLALACNAVKLDLFRKLDELTYDNKMLAIQHNRRGSEESNKVLLVVYNLHRLAG
jgi:hypothetical protein